MKLLALAICLLCCGCGHKTEPPNVRRQVPPDAADKLQDSVNSLWNTLISKRKEEEVSNQRILAIVGELAHTVGDMRACPEAEAEFQKHCRKLKALINFAKMECAP